jgi:hypothetical protein
MQDPSPGKRKPYTQPILKKLTPEQATLFLVGHAYIGNPGAKELLELLFPEPSDLPRTVGTKSRDSTGLP